MEEEFKDAELIEYRSVMGKPDGPEIDHPYFGRVPTFLNENREADGQAGTDRFNAKVLSRLPRLMYHVPLDMRGPYKIPEGTKSAFGERLGPANYALCSGTVGKNNPEQGRLCRAKAVNRSGRCSRHGGMLNPADRQRIDWDKAPRHIKFKYGFLKADDLDDEELARGQIRLEDGSYTKNGFVSAEIYAEFKNRLFERGDVLLREAYIDAVKTFAEISKNDSYEPQDRLKAAEFIFTRLRGKLPDVVELKASKPFEDVMMEMVGGSRSDSRARRGEDAEITDYIDAEVVEELREYASDDQNWLLSEGEAADVLTDEGDLKVYDTQERMVDDFVPEKATWNGPIGKVTTETPRDPEIRDRVESVQADLNGKAAAKERAFLRKAHKEKVRKAMAKRKWAQGEGMSGVPKPAKMIVFEEEEYDEFENEVTIRLEMPDA